jgi:hypothetical protein
VGQSTAYNGRVTGTAVSRLEIVQAKGRVDWKRAVERSRRRGWERDENDLETLLEAVLRCETLATASVSYLKR